jgi:hypothetical protein
MHCKVLRVVLAMRLSFDLEFSRSRKFPGVVQPILSEDSFAGSPPRGRIVDEFCGVENLAQAAAVTA